MFLPAPFSRMLARVVDLAQGRGVWQAYGRLQESQWWPRQRLREYQQEALHRRLADLAPRSAWLKDALRTRSIDASAFGDLAALDRLPMLDRQLLQHDGRRVAAEGLAPGQVLSNSTGGSTGRNVHFGVDLECWRQRDAVDLRLWSFLGLEPGSRAVYVWGAPMDLTAARSGRERLRRFIDNKRMYNAYRLGARQVDALLDDLARIRPQALFGYASVLDMLARRAGERGGLEGPRVVVSSAEALFPDQRQRMAAGWGADVFNLYGCREVGLVALECTAHQGLHVMDERLIVEAGPHGGEAEELRITDLDNRATPFVRYRIGDLASAGPSQSCPCGRGLSRLGEVAGRVLDVIRGAEGQAVGGTFWSLLMRTGVSGVSSFQVVQHELDAIEIRVTPVGALNQEARRKVTETVRSALGRGMQVAFSEHAALEPLASGKHRFIVSRLSGGTDGQVGGGEGA